MLYLDAPLELRGVTLYRDYHDPRLFHYLPRHPRLSRRGADPLFQLLLYRRTTADAGDLPEGGGFLVMTVDVGVSESTKSAIKAELSSRVGGEVRLAPVQFESGTVRVSALGASTGGAPGEGEDAAPRFVERILASEKPSLYGDNAATFSLELDREGAVLMRASVEPGGATQVGVVYDLSFKGLMPAYRASIRIRFQQSYRHLRDRMQVNTLYFKADLDREFEQLRKKGDIAIVSEDYRGMTPEEQTAETARLEQLAKDLAAWTLFKPALTPGTVVAVDRGTLTVNDPTAAALAHTAGFTTPLILEWGAGGTAPSTVAAHVDRAGGIGGQDPAQGAANPAETTPGETGGSGGTTAGAGAGTPSGGTGGQGSGGQPAGRREPTAVERWNAAGRPQAGYLLRSLNQDELQEATYELKVVSAVTRTIGPQGTIRTLAGDGSLAGRIQEVDLRSDFFTHFKGTVSTSADLAAAGVNRMNVELEYGVKKDGTRPQDHAEILLGAAGESGAFDFFVDHQRSTELAWRVHLSHRDDHAIGDTSPTTTSPWFKTTARNLDVNPRQVSPIFLAPVTAGDIDWDQVRSVQVEVAYADPASGIDAKRLLVFDREHTTHLVPIRPRNPTRRTWTATATWHLAGGERETQSFERTGTDPLVLNPPPSRSVTVRLSMADPLNRYERIEVELERIGGGGGSRMVTLTAGAPSASWVLPRASEAETPVFRHRATAFLANKSVVAGEWVQTSDPRVTLGDAAYDGLLSVDVRVLVQDLAAAELLAVKLRMEYPDALPGADAIEERLISGPADGFTWQVARRRGGASTWRYTVDWIGLDGTKRTVGPVETTEEVLLVHPALLQ